MENEDFSLKEEKHGKIPGRLPQFPSCGTLRKSGEAGHGLSRDAPESLARLLNGSLWEEDVG